MDNCVIKIGGMSCQGCVRNITGVLQAVPGVEQVSVSLEEGIATVAYDSAKANQSQFKSAIEDAGFDVL